MKRIALFDPSELFRELLTSYFHRGANVRVIYSSGALEEIHYIVSLIQLDIVILDAKGMSEDVWKVLMRDQEFFQRTKLIVLTNEISKEIFLKLKQIGASGYYSKNTSLKMFEQILDTEFSAPFNQEMQLGADVREKLVEMEVFGSKKSGTSFGLSIRELEILRLICLEYSNLEMSNRLNLSIRTIESHRSRMIEKSGCLSIIGVIVRALTNNNDFLKEF